MLPKYVVLVRSLEDRQTEGGRGENKLFLRVAKPLCAIACPLSNIYPPVSREGDSSYQSWVKARSQDREGTTRFQSQKICTRYLIPDI